MAYDVEDSTFIYQLALGMFGTPASLNLHACPRHAHVRCLSSSDLPGSSPSALWAPVEASMAQ